MILLSSFWQISYSLLQTLLKIRQKILHSQRILTFNFKKKKETLWPLFMYGVQLPPGYSHFEEAIYFLPLSFQKFLVLTENSKKVSDH